MPLENYRKVKSGEEYCVRPYFIREFFRILEGLGGWVSGRTGVVRVLQVGRDCVLRRRKEAPPCVVGGDVNVNLGMKCNFCNDFRAIYVSLGFL